MNLNKIRTAVFGGLSLLAAICGNTQAGTIIGAVGVQTPSGAFDFDPNNLINQSGLSANYVSGVTDYASFVASTTATYGNPWSASSALGSASGANPDFLFDLGGVYAIDGAALWNQSGTASLLEYAVYGSLDGITYALLGNGSLPDGGFDVPAYTSSWAAANVRYIKLSTVANNGFGGATKFNEIVFSGTSIVPEPTSAGLWVLGATGLAFARRRQR